MEIKNLINKDTRKMRFETDDIEDWKKIGFKFDETPYPAVDGLYATFPEGWHYEYVYGGVSYEEAIRIFDEKGFYRAHFVIEHRRSRDIFHYIVRKRFYIYQDDVKDDVIVYFGERDNPLFIAGYANWEDDDKIEELENMAKKFAEKNYPEYNNPAAYWDNEPREYVSLNEIKDAINKKAEKEKLKELRANLTEAKAYEAMARAFSGENQVIEHMEEEGQYEAITNVLMARKMEPPREEWEKLGFSFKDLESDNVLCQAELPEGWILAPTDHSMWNRIYDDKDRVRGSMFYKAAFYDRSAHMYLSPRYGVKTRFVGPKEQDAEIYFGNEDEVLFVAGIVEGLYNYKLDDNTRKQKREEEKRLLKLAFDFAEKNYPNYGDVNAYWDTEPTRKITI